MIIVLVRFLFEELNVRTENTYRTNFYCLSLLIHPRTSIYCKFIVYYLYSLTVPL